LRYDPYYKINYRVLGARFLKCGLAGEGMDSLKIRTDKEIFMKSDRADFGEFIKQRLVPVFRTGRGYRVETEDLIQTIQRNSLELGDMHRGGSL